MTFDYIVVGAGSAGCVLANRLSADSGKQVLLLEAGGSDRNVMVSMPLAWHPLSEMARFGWNYATIGEDGVGGRKLPQPRGKLLGGTSSINGMMYSRGNAADYDGWAAEGLKGWSFDEVLPYFRRSETNWRGASVHHGGSGPLNVAANPKHPVIYPAMIAAAKALGYASLDDFHGASQYGFSMPDFTYRNGRRESSATAFLRPAMKRPNLRVETGAQATRIVFEGKRAVGVDYVRNGAPRSARASEIVLSGGAFNSPHLLLLSGVGPAEELRAKGVEPVADLPFVGRHLKDHPLALVVYESSRPFEFDSMLRLDRLAFHAARWLLTGKGPIGEAPLSVQGYLRQDPASPFPDTQMQISHVSMLARPWFPGWREGSGHQFTATALQLHPRGSGSVTLSSKDPLQPPEIRLGLLEDEADRAFARNLVRLVRRFFATEPAKSLVKAELMPGPQAASDEALDAYLKSMLHTGMHPACTCRMGLDPRTSVVDAALKVHGIEGLRVADASVMPEIISGNTSAPSMMIGEKAADLILGRAAQQS